MSWKQSGRGTGRVRLGLAVTMVVAASMLVGAAKAKITTHVDPDHSFARPATYAWTTPSGTLRFLQTAETDPERWRQSVDGTIVGGIDAELRRRGYTVAPADSAALSVTYYILVGPDIGRQKLGQFAAPVSEWGLPPLVGVTTAYSVAEQGSLIVDLTSREPKRVVWRGVIQARVHLEKGDAERNAAIARHITDLFKKFPRT